MKELSSIEKMKLWRQGTRKLNVGACSIEKLEKYLKICNELGYTEQEEELKKEIGKRTASKTDLKSITPKQRLEFWKKKVRLTGKTGDDVYFYPKTKEDYGKIYQAFEKNVDTYMNGYPEDDIKRRLKEFKEGFGGDTFSLFTEDDGEDDPSMELEFTGDQFTTMPNDMQIACCEIEWTKE